MKPSQKRKTKAGESEDSEVATSLRLSSRQVPHSCSTVYDVKCIFCQKNTKFIRGQKTRESLIQCRELRADSSIRNAAIKKMDGRMLAIVSRDLVPKVTITGLVTDHIQDRRKSLAVEDMQKTVQMN